MYFWIPEGKIVVPYIGTWIETGKFRRCLATCIRRTLYRYVDWNCWFDGQSGYSLVVPYIGTWIETFLELSYYWHSSVVPYIGTWIETYKEIIEGRFDVSRTLYRYVDWNHTERPALTPKKRRTLYRYVDWNHSRRGSHDRARVVPYIGTWIETVVGYYVDTFLESYLI